MDQQNHEPSLWDPLRTYRPETRVKLERAAELVRRGLSVREAAKKVGVGRTTVGHYLKWKADQTPVYQRCPSCGAKTTLPCSACMARKFRERQLRFEEAQRRRSK